MEIEHEIFMLECGLTYLLDIIKTFMAEETAILLYLTVIRVKNMGRA